jgi:hypothetical protein
MAKLKFKKDSTDKALAATSAGLAAKRDADMADKADAGMAQVKADAAKPSAPAPAKKQSFRAAFADARKSGGSTFMWNGKSYNTKLASDAPARKAAPAAKPSTPAPAAKASASTAKVTADSARGASLRASLDNARAAPKPAPKPDARASYQSDKAARLKATMDAGRAPGASGYAKSRAKFYSDHPEAFMKKGGKIDGIAKRGLTRGSMKCGGKVR